MKAVKFVRVSSKEQEETGYSLPAQEKLLDEYIDKKRIKSVKTFSISESASGKKQRTIFNEMMSYVQQKNIKIIICEKVDRLTRNFKDAVCVNDWINKDFEREVHFIKENCILNKESKSNEKFIWNIKVSVAQYYIDNLSEEVRKGTKEKAEQGWYPGNHKMGYISKGEKGHKIWVIDTSEKSKVPMIKEAFKLYSEGNYSTKELARLFSNSGWKMENKREIIKSTMHKLLTDSFYCGEFDWNKKHYPNAKHKPIVSKELFYAVQEKLKGKTTPRYRKHFPLFKGLMRCDECGGTISWETHKNHWYGSCNHYKNCSQKTYVRQELVEEQLLQSLKRIVLKDEMLVDWLKQALKESHQDEIKYNEKAIQESENMYNRAVNRLDGLYDDKLDGNITTEEYKRKSAQYTEEKEKAIEQKTKLNLNQNRYYEVGINILDLAYQARDIYLKRKQNHDKRMLLNLIFSNLTLNEGKLDVKYTEAFEILSKYSSELNKNFEPQIQTSQIPVLTCNKQQNTSLQGALCAKNSSWLRSSDSNREPSR